MSIKLQGSLDRVNGEFFQMEDLPPIKWSRGRIKNRYRRLTLGVYDISKNEIRIHPLFRERDIPEFVLDYIVYHELLHYQDRHRLKKRVFFWGRRKIHDKSFHDREKSYPKKKEAAVYIKSMLRGQFPSASEVKNEA